MIRLITSTIALAAIGLAAGPAGAQTYGFGTMGEGTNSYSIGSAITKLMVEELGLEARVQPSGGTTDFLPLWSASASRPSVARRPRSRDPCPRS